MPSIKTITPILGGNYYHLFNRGANKQLLFYTPDNYKYFLKLLSNFLLGYIELLAYSLLPNHFHIIIKVIDQIENSSLEEEIGKLVVKQLKRMFITYAMAINNQENRVGNLFDPKYKRLQITNEEYLKYVIFYCHYNPEKHGLINDYKNYRYSSFYSLLSKSRTNIVRNSVMELFGGRKEFLNYHSFLHLEKANLIIE